MPKRIEDHPRVYGENKFCILYFGIVKGSPPRIRGKLKEIRRRIGDAGITPAYTGKTYLKHLNPLLLKDHPRVYGENILYT